jgi:hypothetical protein
VGGEKNVNNGYVKFGHDLLTAAKTSLLVLVNDKSIFTSLGKFVT